MCSEIQSGYLPPPREHQASVGRPSVNVRQPWRHPARSRHRAPGIGLRETAYGAVQDGHERVHDKTFNVQWSQDLPKNARSPAVGAPSFERTEVTRYEPVTTRPYGNDAPPPVDGRPQAFVRAFGEWGRGERRAIVREVRCVSIDVDAAQDRTHIRLGRSQERKPEALLGPTPYPVSRPLRARG